MLVHELIEALNKLPPDWPVVVWDCEWGAEPVLGVEAQEVYVSEGRKRNILLPVVEVKV